MTGNREVPFQREWRWLGLERFCIADGPLAFVSYSLCLPLVVEVLTGWEKLVFHRDRQRAFLHLGRVAMPECVWRYRSLWEQRALAATNGNGR